MRYTKNALSALFLLLAPAAEAVAQESPKPAEPAKETIRGGLAHSPGNWLKISGQVRVLNGYTIAFADGKKVELEDGPELEQQGKIGGQLYPAGKEAAEFLRKLIGDRPVTMYVNAGTDEFRRGDRVVGECYIGDQNLGTELIAAGWAIADHSLKVSAELIARQNKRGLWRGEFVPPQKWRKGERLPGEPVAAPPGNQGDKPEEAKPKVIRDEVKGSINHGGGDTMWHRVIGKARVIDAATLEFADGTRVELDITVPAPDQKAMNGDGLYPCGKDAADFLRNLIGERPVMCFQNGDGPWMGYAGDTNLERAMTVNGWALADHSSMHADEIIARENKRGLWQGKFIHPDTWRAGVRLPGETPPPKLKDEAAASRLIASYDSDEDALPLIILRVLSDVPTLRHLYFSQRSKLTDDGLAQLAKLDRLEVLNMAGCWQITDAGLAHLKALPRLKQLSLPHTTADAGLAHLVNLTELEKLSIEHWRGDAITDAGLLHLAKLRHLKHLTLTGLETTDAGLAHIKDLQDLAILEFGHVPIGDPGLAHLGQLKKLQYLDLSDCEVTDAGLDHLIGMKHLQVLKLPNRITDKAKKRLQEVIPALQFEGEPREILEAATGKQN